MHTILSYLGSAMDAATVDTPVDLGHLVHRGTEWRCIGYWRWERDGRYDPVWHCCLEWRASYRDPWHTEEAWVEETTRQPPQAVKRWHLERWAATCPGLAEHRVAPVCPHCGLSQAHIGRVEDLR